MLATDVIGIAAHFMIRIEAAGLPTAVVESVDDLETLIAETYAIADQLDGLPG